MTIRECAGGHALPPLEKTHLDDTFINGGAEIILIKKNFSTGGHVLPPLEKTHLDDAFINGGR